MFNSILIILISLTNNNISLSYPSQFVNKKQRIVHGQGAPNLLSLKFVAFQNQSTLITVL